MRDLINIMEASPTIERVIQHPGFQSWFAGSKVVDGDGHPAVCYHGTFEDFAEFRHESENRKSYGFNRLGYWFDVDPRTPSYFAGVGAHRIDSLPDGVAGGGNVMPCFLRVTKPLYMDSEGLWGDDVEKMQEYYALHKRYNAYGREEQRGLRTEDGQTFIAKSDGLPFDRARYEELGKEVHALEASYQKSDGWHRLMAHLPNGVKSKDHEVDEFKAAVMAEGYDGIYISDTLADHGSRNYETSHWWIVFDPKNIKSVFAKDFTDSENISESFDSSVQIERVDIEVFEDVEDPVDGFKLVIPGSVAEDTYVVFYDMGPPGHYGCNFGWLECGRMQFLPTGAGGEFKIMAGVFAAIRAFTAQYEPDRVVMAAHTERQQKLYMALAKKVPAPSGYYIDYDYDNGCLSLFSQ